MNGFLTQSIAFLISSAALTAALSDPTKTIKDGISLEVSNTALEGKNLVKSRLTNGSEFPLCTGCYLYKNVFYAKLTDRYGNELLPYEEWAKKYKQKSSYVYQHPRSHNFFDVKPGASVEFEFFLEEAYPAEALAKAVQLEMSFETMYGGADVDFDGKPYRFPPDWKTSVTVPLADIGLGAAVGKEAGKAPPAAKGLAGSGSGSSFESQSPHSTGTDGGPGRWPLIAAILFLLLALCVWLIGRRRSRSKAEG